MTSSTHTDTSPDDRWQRLLDSYCEFEQRHKRLLQWRAVGYALLLYSLAKLFFLLGSFSHFHIYWLIIAIAGILLAVPLTLHCQLALRRLLRSRKHLAHELFCAGLRVDEDHRLLTNSAHPKVVARTPPMSEGR